MSKSNYVIISDGACDLVEDIVGLEYVVPFSVSLDGEKYYKSNQGISVDTFFKELSGSYPKTSVPSVSDFVEKFDPQLKKGLDIICVTISSHLSSSYQSAHIAADMMRDKYKDRSIYLVDSLQATVSQGLLVREMLEMQKQGETVDKVYHYAMNAKDNGGVNFVVGDMSYLSTGGRICKVALQTGKTLNLNPVISLIGGKNSSRGMCRNNKSMYKSLLKITNENIQTGEASNYIFAIGYSDEESLPRAKYLQELIRQEFGSENVSDMIRIGPTIIAHTGPGTYGIGYIKRATMPNDK